MCEMTPTTPDEFFWEMFKIADADPDGLDAENAHKEADKLICRVLKELGYGKGVIVFREMERWYA